MVSLYARLKPFQHKINPHDYAMSLKTNTDLIRYALQNKLIE